MPVRKNRDLAVSDLFQLSSPSISTLCIHTFDCASEAKKPTQINLMNRFCIFDAATPARGKTEATSPFATMTPNRATAPRPSDRTDLDMVAQRHIRLEERAAQRNAQDATLSDYHSFIIKQRGYQIRASHLLLIESQLYQSNKKKALQQKEKHQEDNLPEGHKSCSPLTGNHPVPPPRLRTPGPDRNATADQTVSGVTKFSPRWYHLVHDDISLLLFDKERNYCATVRQQLAEFHLFA